MKSPRYSRVLLQVCLIAFSSTCCASGFVTPTRGHLAERIDNPEPEVQDQFGGDVAISNDLLVVGASQDDAAGVNSGSVYVYRRAGTDWVLAQRLLPEDAAAGDWFGFPVSISDGTILIGASRKSGGIGAAYVFTEDPGGQFIQQAKLLPGGVVGGCGDPIGCYLFGVAAEISGSTAVIGASTESTRQGAAYVFVRGPDNVWTQQARLVAADGAAQHQFGSALAIDGDTVIVGSQFAPFAGSSAGAAYVFERAGTNWSQQQRLDSPEARSCSIFGFSVSISGTTALVGARLFSPSGAQLNHGAAYVYERDAMGIWQSQAILRASDANGGAAGTGCDSATAFGDQFGYAVALKGNEAVVTRLTGIASFPSPREFGAAYLFTRSGTTWTEVDRVVPSDGSPGESFGRAVDFDAQTFAIGASLRGVGPNEVQATGAAYFIDRRVEDGIFADGFED